MILSHLSFLLGHLVSMAMNHARGDLAFEVLYPIYSWLMVMSLDLDTKDQLWKEPTL